MLSIHAGNEGLPQVVAQLSGVAVYLDNWAIIELANGDPKRRERFVTALKSCGSLLFSFTNSIELGEAEGEPAKRVRAFLDEIGAHWIPLELNPWTVAKREPAGQTDPTPCISMVFIEAFFKNRLYELSPEGSKVVDLSAEHFFKMSSAMKWANDQKEGTRASAKEIDDTLINRVAADYIEDKKDPSILDKTTPPVRVQQGSARPVRVASAAERSRGGGQTVHAEEGRRSRSLSRGSWKRLRKPRGAGQALEAARRGPPATKRTRSHLLSKGARPTHG